jgi:hypothetical protein
MTGHRLQNLDAHPSISELTPAIAAIYNEHTSPVTAYSLHVAAQGDRETDYTS